MTLTPSRPIIRYHGGKWRLAPWIISHFPKHRVYVEPFGGAASVLLRKPRSYAEVYNDLDGEIVNLFRVARDRGEELLRAVELTPFARDEFLQSYEAATDPVEQARRTMVRCGMGFGSTAANPVSRTGFRGSATRAGSTPASDWVNLSKSLVAVIHRLRGVIVESRDALELMRYRDAADTLHYVDPPYLPETRTFQSGRGAYKHELDETGHSELLEVLHGLKGSVVLSGYPNKLYADALRGWRYFERKAKADGRVDRTEAIWISPSTPVQEVMLSL